MIPEYLQLHGVSKVNRHEMIARVKEAILKGGGYVTDFHMFSNTAICLNFEVSVENIEKLYTALRREAFLNQESHDLLAGCCDRLAQVGTRAKERELMGTLEITFIHNEPDLRIEVPPIPG